MEKMNEWSPEESATPEIQNFCNEIKPALEGKLGKNFAQFTAIRFIRLSLCGGTHYMIKVHVGTHEYIHVKVIQVITQNPFLKLCGYQLPETEEDPIIPFVCM